MFLEYGATLGREKHGITCNGTMFIVNLMNMGKIVSKF
jgi:hypothetical protein